MTPDWRSRVPSRLNTALGLPDGGKLRTIEHLMASLSAFGIDNALIEVEGREIPIFDGSARRWCDLLAAAGIDRQAADRRVIRVTRPLQVRAHAGFLRVEPHDGFALDVTYDRLPAFGVLRWAGEVTRDSFVRDLSRSRSPGRPLQWVRHLAPKAGRDLLSWLENGRRRRHRHAGDTQPRNVPVGACEMPDDIRAAMPPPVGREPVLRGLRPGRVAIVLGRRILGGARYPDEPVRHAALDLVGDLALAGFPLLGRVVAHSPTHALTWALVATLMRNPDAWTFEAAASSPEVR